MKSGKMFSQEVAKGIALITQVGLTMMVPIFMCLAIGLCLNKWTGSKGYAIFFIFLGAAAGFRNVYVITLEPILRQEREKLKKKELEKEQDDNEGK